LGTDRFLAFLTNFPIFIKFFRKYLVDSKNLCTFAPAIQKWCP